MSNLLIYCFRLVKPNSLPEHVFEVDAENEKGDEVRD